jgi:hypothetical protein
MPEKKEPQMSSVTVCAAMLASLSMLSAGVAASKQDAFQIALVSEPSSTALTPAISTAQREKIRNFIRGRLAIEQNLQSRLHALQKKYASIDFDTIYEPVDLVSAQGILAARIRLNSFSTMVEELNLLVRGHWTDWEHQIEFTDIEEPLASQVRRGFADAKPQILRSYGDWMDACRANAAAILELLDFAEHNLGFLKLEHEQIVPAPRISSEFGALQLQVATAEKRNNEARRTALTASDGTTKMLTAALRR